MKKDKQMYLVGIDETGNSSSFKTFEKKIRAGESIDADAEKYIIAFALIKEKDFSKLKEEIHSLKKKFNIPTETPIHAVDFVNRVGKSSRTWHFKKLLAFSKEIERITKETDYTLYLSLVDVVSHVRKYADPFEPYNLSIELMMNKLFKKFPRKQEFLFNIEARGKKEDKPVELTMKSIIAREGREDYVKIKFDSKGEHNYSELIEFTDIICYIFRSHLIHSSNRMKALQREGVFNEVLINELLKKIKEPEYGKDVIKIPL